MRNKVHYRSFLPVYALIVASAILLTMFGNRAVTVVAMNSPVSSRKTVIIDAGHGGVDGGATSCTGILESAFNLTIALKLNDLLHLLGINTVMIRDGDYSVYTQGSTISQKKVSDLKERVRIANSTEDSIIVSIHQNYFSDSKYRGAQVFYAPTPGSKELATVLQNAFRLMDTANNRQEKKSDGIYLMQHISGTGVLIECGFISNTEEEALLRSKSYQNKLCAVIASVCSNYLHA